MNKNKKNSNNSLLFTASLEKKKFKLRTTDIKSLPSEKKTDLVLIETMNDTALINDICEKYKVQNFLDDMLLGKKSSQAIYFRNYCQVLIKYSFYEKEELKNKQLVLILGNDFCLCFCEEKNFFRSFSEKKFAFEEKATTQMLTPSLFFFTFLSFLTQKNGDALDTLQKKINTLDKEVEKKPSQDQIFAFNKLNKDIKTLMINSRPIRELLLTFEKEYAQFNKELSSPHYFNTYNTLSHYTMTLEYKKSYLLNLKDFILASLSNRMTITAQFLTVAATIFMPLTFITGVYGMNFIHMPELPGEYSYYYCLGFMASLGILQVIYFKKKKWL